MRQLTIAETEAGQRFDKFLKKYFRGATDGFLYKMLRKKNITLNGKKASGSEMTACGDTVRLFLSEETIEKFRGSHPEKDRTPPASHAGGTAQAADSRAGAPSAGNGGRPDVGCSVIYRDRHILLVSKPAGMLVQPAAAGRQESSLADILPVMLLEEHILTAEDMRAFRPAPVNRIDRNTSGIVMCGISLRGEQCLSEMIRSGQINKEYLVFVKGRFSGDGIYRAYGKYDRASKTLAVSEDPAGDGRREIVTGIRTVGCGDQCSLLLVRLFTGMTHQIRAHLRYLGYPVIGDPKYGDPGINRAIFRECGIRRQLLHAWRITFPRNELAGDVSGKTFSAEIPGDFLLFARHRKMTGMLEEAGALPPVNG